MSQDPSFLPVDPHAGDPDRPVPASHRHWHALGLPLIMLELNRLQGALSGADGGVLPAGEIERIKGYSWGRGKADVEAMLKDGDGPVDEEEWLAAEGRVPAGAYFGAVALSERILARIGGEASREEAAATVCEAMRTSYRLGRAAAKTDADKRQAPGPAMRP